MNYTSNYGFKKPEPLETRNVNDFNDSFDMVDEKLKETQDKNINLEGTFNQLIINAGNSNAEIVAARGTEVSLPVRLNKVDSDLAEKASQVDLNTTNTNLEQKANQTDLNTNLNVVSKPFYV